MARKKKSDTIPITGNDLMAVLNPAVLAEELTVTESQLSATSIPARLTLLQIDEELYALLKLEEEMLDSPSTPPEELEIIRNEIGKYLTLGESKINAIATTYNTCIDSASICKTHADHYTKMKKRWESHAKSIQYSVHHTMILTGSKEYKTAEHRVALVGVGGVEPLESNLEVMKKESPGFVKVLVEMTLEHWEMLKLFNDEELKTAEVKDCAVDNEGTRAALGAGKTVVGARLLPRGERVKIE